MDMHRIGGNALPMAKTPKHPGKRAVPGRRNRPEDDRRTFPPLPLKAWFKLCRVKQRQVADAIGTDESHLSLIASGRRAYMRHHLEDIAEFLSQYAKREITPAMLLNPPGEQQLADIISRMPPERQRRAARVLEAMDDE